MKISAGKYYFEQGVMPVMELTIDGHRVLFGTDIKQNILEEYDAVHMDGYPAADLPVIKLAPPYTGELVGFTTDAAIVALVRRFLDATENETFTAGEIEI